MKKFKKLICIFVIVLFFVFASACSVQKATSDVKNIDNNLEHTTETEQNDDKNDNLDEDLNNNSLNDTENEIEQNKQPETNNEQNNENGENNQQQEQDIDSTNVNEETPSFQEDEEDDKSENEENNEEILSDNDEPEQNDTHNVNEPQIQEYELFVNDAYIENGEEFFAQTIVENSSIKLLKDITIASARFASSTTLDLNGHTLTINSNINVSGECSFTITDSDNFGRIVAGNIESSGDVFIFGGIIDCEYSRNDGDMKVRGGYFNADIVESFWDYLDNGYNISSDTIDMFGNRYYSVNLVD